ncbi:hypothetical protein MIND_00606600 [Mycena indigotica]|uniref:MARVEL domain-containing protein n=1 Tax=Mycena indigotica TaxID=2126181 RepID=A0A8H6SPS9_9AGAR|nr:uncharacterized protein MIND_00606600 [Mycena indigotica]KAF7303770.1 hypothetical protein MIND_00606600 [Mycena indigotica]
MSFSKVGRAKVAAHLLLLLLNIIVLALSTRVNLYQDFFFIADRFPFVLSIITFALVGTMTFVDFCFNSSYTGRPQFEIGVFSVLGIFWLAFNAFSSSRWQSVPLNCGVIPSDFPDTIQWCQELAALRILVWIEWLMFFFTTIITLRYSITQSNLGNKHIFRMPLSRYDPSIRPDENTDFVEYGRDSQFLPYAKMN